MKYIVIARTPGPGRVQNWIAATNLLRYTLAISLKQAHQLVTQSIASLEVELFEPPAESAIAELASYGVLIDVSPCGLTDAIVSKSQFLCLNILQVKVTENVNLSLSVRTTVEDTKTGDTLYFSNWREYPASKPKAVLLPVLQLAKVYNVSNGAQSYDLHRDLDRLAARRFEVTVISLQN